MPAELLDRVKRLVPLTMKRRVSRIRLATRWPTHGLRALPDFLIIGAQRCGTSSLYKYLGQHPRVSPSLRKETQYFATSYHRGLPWYRSHFRVRWPAGAAGAGPSLLSFEATPDYLLHPLAAARASRLVPAARIIVLLRDPVRRAFSHYRHMQRLGFETLPFEMALELEPSRLEGEVERLLEDSSYAAKSLRRFSYLERGYYAKHLEPWFEHYDPDQVLVLASEDFFADTEGEYRRVLDFLELPSGQMPRFHNYSYRKAADVPTDRLDPELARRLGEHFAPHNEELYELLGRDMGW